MNHELKTWPEAFRDVVLGHKRYEVRKNDRGFQVGDVLELMEYEPGTACALDDGRYTGGHAVAVVEYMTPGGRWGLPEDLCVLGIRVVQVHLRKR